MSIRGSPFLCGDQGSRPAIYSVRGAGKDGGAVIDMRAPLELGGKAGLFRGAGVGQTVKELRGLQIIKTRGDIDKNRVAHWHVTLKTAFIVE